MPNATDPDGDLSLEELKDIERKAMDTLQLAGAQKVAASRLRPFDQEQLHVFVGLAGSAFDNSEQVIVPGLRIRIDRIERPPGIFQILNAASHEKLDYLGVARLASAIRAQVSLVTAEPQETNLTLDGLWNFVVLLRLRAYPKSPDC